MRYRGEAASETAPFYLATLRRHIEANPAGPKGLAAQQEAIATWREHIARLDTALSQAR